MKNILVPIDFSECSENALYMAASVAKKVGAELHLVHTLNMGDSILLDAEDDAIKAAPYILAMEEKFAKYIKKPYLEGIKIGYFVRQKSVYEEITDVINEVEADLIIMGSHGASGLQEFFVGSNTQKVVRNSKVPVMVIKNKMEGFSIEDAVFACDFKFENVDSYKNAKSFFEMLEIKMNLLYVNKPDAFVSTPKIKQRIKEFFDLVDVEVHPPVEIFNEYSVEDGIMAYCKQINANFIGIPTHGRKGFSHIFTGSIGEDVVNHSTIPVVTFKI